MYSPLMASHEEADKTTNCKSTSLILLSYFWTALFLINAGMQQQRWKNVFMDVSSSSSSL